jgi:hypothetical protein
MSRLSSTTLEIACVALEYTSTELLKLYTTSGVVNLKKAAEAQIAARAEIRAFLDAPEPVQP